MRWATHVVHAASLVFAAVYHLQLAYVAPSEKRVAACCLPLNSIFSVTLIAISHLLCLSLEPSADKQHRLPMFACIQSCRANDMIIDIDEDHLQGRRVIRPLPSRVASSTSPGATIRNPSPADASSALGSSTVATASRDGEPVCLDQVCRSVLFISLFMLTLFYHAVPYSARNVRRMSIEQVKLRIWAQQHLTWRPLRTFCSGLLRYISLTHLQVFVCLRRIISRHRSCIPTFLFPRQRSGSVGAYPYGVVKSSMM